MKSVLGVVVLSAGLAAGLAGEAAAETVNCTEITALPYTISVPGPYCLKKSFQPNLASGAAISINATAVVLDLNGYRINNSNGPATTAIGIHAVNKENVVIRNGILRGFLAGVVIEETTGLSRGNVVEDLIVDANWFSGITLMGEGSTVRRCQAQGIGALAAYAKGIEVIGDRHVVAENQVGGFPVSDGRGILTSGSHHVVLDNRVMGANYGLQLSSTTKYRDNVVSDAVIPYSGGVNIGNNN